MKNCGHNTGTLLKLFVRKYSVYGVSKEVAPDTGFEPVTK